MKAEKLLALLVYGGLAASVALVLYSVFHFHLPDFT
jgi:hypothetical protein